MKEQFKALGIGRGMVKQIAERAGVSPTTVRNTLSDTLIVSEKTRRKVALALQKVRQQTQEEREQTNKLLAL